MENLLTIIYEGGIYRFNELTDLLDDIGGHILRREDTAISTMAIISINDCDRAIVEAKINEIGGEVKQAPLAGTEIAVVSPSPSGKHLPHPVCDIAEFLRRSGAQTILISLARGLGQEPILEIDEEKLINECDLAIFAFGDSKYCLENKKSDLLKRLTVPVIVTGGPSTCSIPYSDSYVGGFGRKAMRLKNKDELRDLSKLVEAVTDCLEAKKTRIYSDFPDISLPALSRSIEKKLPEIKNVLSPSPITQKIDGLRMKLPFDEYADRISKIKFNESNIADFATISKSILMDNILIKINSK
jgi:putative methanogenesis marker protein 7